MSYQAPVAGLILEDAVKDTVVDRLLQPIARGKDRGQAAVALIAPPLIALALERAATLPPQQQQMQVALLMPLLKESLRMWMVVAGPKIVEQQEKNRQFEEEFGSTIDDLIAEMFAPPVWDQATQDDGVRQAQTVPGVMVPA